MNCHTCDEPLEGPGDYCLVCRSTNCASVYITIAEYTATVLTLSETDCLAERTVSFQQDERKYQERVERNFTEQIADIVRRKRPSTVYLSASPKTARRLRSTLPTHDMSLFEPRGDGTDVEQVLRHMESRQLDRVQMDPQRKVGGSHTTVIGGRDGQSALHTIASCPFVKKVIPGPIDGGGNSGGGFRVQPTRPESNGNLRVLFKQGGTVQTIRVVTTAATKSGGETIQHKLDDTLE